MKQNLEGFSNRRKNFQNISFSRGVARIFPNFHEIYRNFKHFYQFSWISKSVFIIFGKSCTIDTNWSKLTKYSIFNSHSHIGCNFCQKKVWTSDISQKSKILLWCHISWKKTRLDLKSLNKLVHCTCTVFTQLTSCF